MAIFSDGLAALVHQTSVHSNADLLESWLFTILLALAKHRLLWVELLFDFRFRVKYGQKRVYSRKLHWTSLSVRREYGSIELSCLRYVDNGWTDVSSSSKAIIFHQGQVAFTTLVPLYHHSLRNLFPPILTFCRIVTSCSMSTICS